MQGSTPKYSLLQKISEGISSETDRKENKEDSTRSLTSPVVNKILPNEDKIIKISKADMKFCRENIREKAEGL